MHMTVKHMQQPTPLPFLSAGIGDVYQHCTHVHIFKLHPYLHYKYILETGLGRGCRVGAIDLELGTGLGSTNGTKLGCCNF